MDMSRGPGFAGLPPPKGWGGQVWSKLGIVFLLFLYGFCMVFLRFPYGFPAVFHFSQDGPQDPQLGAKMVNIGQHSPNIPLTWPNLGQLGPQILDF